MRRCRTRSRGNNDRTVPSLANLPGATGFSPGASFPRPYYEGPTATSNNLADLAMYYWIRDIRPRIRRQGEGLARALAARHAVRPVDRRPRNDRLSERHQRDHRRHGRLAVLRGAGNGGPEAIDDLWHAAVNSRGKYFNAQNAQQLAESIVSALADFTDQSGTGTGVGLGGAQSA